MTNPASTDPKELTGAERAAILFLHMPEDTAAEIFKGLSRREMKALATASKKVQGLSPAQVDEILQDFLVEMGSGLTTLRGASKAVSKLAVKALGPQNAAEMIDGGSSSLSETLADMETRTIANLIRKEHPQTIALVLAHMPARQAAEVLGQVPERAQPDVLKRLAHFDQVSPQVVDLIEDALLNEVSMMGKGTSKRFGGVEMVADILNQFEKSREEALMRQIEEEDQPLAEEVRSLMFVFDDLLHLDARGIQTLLKEVERNTLVLALKAADEDLKQHIFKNLSSRAVEMIVEEMENRGPVRLSEVEKAQSEVVRVALALTSSGAIELVKGDSDALV
jgi:flagellar motor switch protein FliG